MKKAAAMVGCIGVFALLLLYQYNQRVNNTMASSVTMVMDTVVEQKLYGKNAAQAVKEIEAKFQDFEDRFSLYREESDIYQINRNAGEQFVPVSEDVYRLISRAKEFSRQSNGAFDLTVAPLTQLWGITSEQPKVPTEEEIQRALALVDHNDVLLQDGQVMLARQGQALDLGAVAKGEACNIVFQTAEKYGITKGYVSIGGNLVVLPETPLGKNAYYFAVRDPQGAAADTLGMLELNGKTMATTGGYERFFEENGQKYHHVLDPATGWPANNGLISVTVISEDGALADYLSTALFVLGKDELNNYLNSPGFWVIAVDDENNVYLSDELQGVFQPNEKQTQYRFKFGEVQ